MLLFVVLEFLLATLSMLFTIGNLGSVAPPMVNIITIDAPAVPFLTNAMDAIAWICPILSRCHAPTNFYHRPMGDFSFKWAGLPVVHSKPPTLMPQLSGVEDVELSLADDVLSANVGISPYVGSYAAKGVPYGTHTAFLVLGSSANASDTFALSPMPSSNTNGANSMHLLTGPAYSSYARQQSFYIRTFSLPPRPWWRDVIHGVGLLCTLLTAIFLDTDTQRKRADLKHKPQFGRAMAHMSPPASLIFDLIIPPIVQPCKPSGDPDNMYMEAVVTETTSTAPVDKSSIETATGEATLVQTEAVPETVANVEQMTALAQVLIILAMVIVSMDHESIDNPLQHTATVPKTEEIVEQLIVVRPDSFNWNESSSSAYFLSLTASKQIDKCDEESREQTFGSFEEIVPSSPMADVFAQEGGGAQPFDYLGGIAQDISLKPEPTVTQEKDEDSAFDIEEILREFSSKAIASAGTSGEAPAFDFGVDFYNVTSPNLFQKTPHLKEVSCPHDIDEGKPVYDFLSTNGFQQWFEPTQEFVSDLGLGEQALDTFDEFLRGLSSNPNAISEERATASVFSNGQITHDPPVGFPTQSLDLGQGAAPVAEYGHQEVCDFSSWFESAQTQKLLDDLADDFPFPLDGPDPNLEIALAAVKSDHVPPVPMDDFQLQQWLGFMPGPMVALGDIPFPEYGTNWGLDLSLPVVAQPELSSAPPSNAGRSHSYFADYDHFTTDDLFALESNVITVSLNSSKVPSKVHVTLDAGHSLPSVAETLIDANTPFIDPDLSSSSTLFQLDEQSSVEPTKVLQESSASVTKASFDSYTPVPVDDFYDHFVSTSKPEKQCGLSASIHAQKSASNSVPIVDVSAVREREQTCHYVIPGVETYEEVKAKLDLYDLFVALVMQKDVVRGVSASIHAVKELAAEDVNVPKTVLNAARAEGNGKVSSKVLVAPMEKGLLIPAVAEDASYVYRPIKSPGAPVNTSCPRPVAPNGPLKKRQIPKDQSIYASMWARCPTEASVPQRTAPHRMDIFVPKVSKAPRERAKHVKDGNINASIWANRPTECKAPQPMTQKRADTSVPKVHKAIQDRSVHASIYTDRPKPVSPKPQSSFRFTYPQADGQHGKNPTSGWTSEELEGARILLVFSGSG